MPENLSSWKTFKLVHFNLGFLLVFQKNSNSGVIEALKVKAFLGESGRISLLLDVRVRTESDTVSFIQKLFAFKMNRILILFAFILVLFVGIGEVPFYGRQMVKTLSLNFKLFTLKSKANAQCLPQVTASSATNVRA